MSIRFSNHGEKSSVQIVKEWILSTQRDNEFCFYDVARETGLSKSYSTTSLHGLCKYGMIKVVKIVSSKPYNGRNSKMKMYRFEKEVEINHHSKHKEHKKNVVPSRKKHKKMIVGEDVLVDFVPSVYKNVSVSKRGRAKELIDHMINLLAELDSLLTR